MLVKPADGNNKPAKCEEKQCDSAGTSKPGESHSNVYMMKVTRQFLHQRKENPAQNQVLLLKGSFLFEPVIDRTFLQE